MSERIGCWMQTYTGLRFWPLDPRPEDFRIEDISHALSMLCRYAGHCIRFYSVAEHCVHVASAALDDTKMAALMHDAAEAYLVDIPRPLKRALVDYQSIEARMMRCIAQRFAFEWPLSTVSVLDNRILNDERDQNMAAPPQWWPEPREPLGVTLRFWTPHEARYEFTKAFYNYGGA